MYQVADSINTGKVSLHFFVDTYTATVGVKSLFNDLFQASSISATANRHQNIFSLNALLALICHSDYLFLISVLFNALNFGASDDSNSSFSQDANKEFAYFILYGCQDLREHFQDGDFCAYGVKHAGQFDTNRTTSN